MKSYATGTGAGEGRNCECYGTGCVEFFFLLVDERYSSDCALLLCFSTSIFFSLDLGVLEYTQFLVGFGRRALTFVE